MSLLVVTSRGTSGMMMTLRSSRSGVGMTNNVVKKRTSSTFTSSTTNNTAYNNPFTRAFQWYSTKLETHPILTKGLTAGTIGAMGDVLCQKYVDQPEKVKALQKNGEEIPSSPLWWWEAKRSARFFGVGVVVVGPWCHAWFGWLARTFPQLTFQSIATRVALDQFAFTPIILSTFISSIWQLEYLMGDATTEQGIPQRLRETLPNVIVANWMVWGPVQLFNFRFVPQPMQVLFANCISLVWNAYLSFSTRAAPSITVEEEQEILDAAPTPVVLVQRISSKMEERLQQQKNTVTVVEAS